MRSVSLKLFILFVLGIVLSVAVVGYASYSISSDVVKRQATLSATNAANQTGDKIELWMKFYEQLVKQIGSDPDINTNIILMDSGDNNSIRLEAKQLVEQKLNSYLLSNEGISGINLLPVSKDGKSITTTTFTFTDEARESEWFQNIVAASGSLLWSPIMANGITGVSKEPVFTLAKKMDTASLGGREIVLMLEVKEQLLLDLIAELQLSGASRVLLTDATYISFADTELGGSAIELASQASEKQVKSDYYKIDGKHEHLVVERIISGVDWRLISLTEVSVLLAEVGQISTLTWIVVLISFVIAVIIGYFFSRMIGRPIIAISRMMKESEAGDLTGRVKVTSKDEIGMLARGYNDMMDKLSELVMQTSQSAKVVIDHAQNLAISAKETETSAVEIAQSTDYIAQGASNLAVQAEQGMMIAQRISEQMHKVEGVGRTMDETASKVIAVNSKGTQYMHQLIDKTEQAESIVSSLSTKAQQFEVSASAITNILELLENVSKQTNILSLNATIEAARASSTAGKGFGVIANEIRHLANQSKASIDEVRLMTNQVQMEARETISLLKAAQPLFRDQLDAVKLSETIFIDVSIQMEEFRSQLTEMLQGNEELNNAQQTLVQTVSEVGATSEQSSAASEQVASLGAEQLKVSANLVNLADQLNEVSKNLQQSLSGLTTKK